MHLTRRTLLRALLSGGGVAALGGGAAVAQAYRFGVTRHTRSLPGLRSPLRVAFLTDLHFGLFIGAGSVRAWVDTVNRQRPDLVLLGGDQLDVRLDSDAAPQALLAELRRLQAPLGVYGVWGNHDYGSFGRYGSAYYGEPRADWEVRRAHLEAAFAQAGVTILRDAGRNVREDLRLGGTDDLWFGRPDVPAALAGAAGRATLLVTHNPDLLPDLPRPVGLVLCGHTHGGQVRLPVVGALRVPSAYGDRYAMGWVQGAFGTPAYVSRGLGLSGAPVRNLCEPEIALFDLQPA
ncbi:metallophosphoesterase [Deinococcus taeanensis]|uniref:metallophosphoesterase n=1 Tax=Deinococcus taeanensis TaxID=2737050 RepID=UPI001CDBC323|nr:metallophosphoesterase [Deinococcus taeanensis]UBV42849.1 metallophosphoesterase [Deinococcus taeanensis]